MGALEILMETRARKEIADQENRTQQTNALLDFALGQQQVKNQERQLDINQFIADANLAKSGLKVSPDGSGFVSDPTLLNSIQKPVYTVDASGNLILTGNVPSKAVVKQLPLNPNQMFERAKASSSGTAQGNLNAPTAEIKNSYSQIKNAELAIKKMEELAGKISSSGWHGAVDLAAGKVSRGESNPELMQYMKEAKANAVSIYRAYTGDTRLSDADAEARAYPLLWNPTEGEKLKDLSFSRIKDVIGTRKTSYESQYGFSTGESSSSEVKIPNFNPKTEKLQVNPKTGKYRVVKK